MRLGFLQDIVLNPEASVLIMTTEIFEYVTTIDRKVADVRYVIFTKSTISMIHSEEASGKKVLFYASRNALSRFKSTIPNVENWHTGSESIQGQKIEIVTHFERVVPLNTRYSKEISA